MYVQVPAGVMRLTTVNGQNRAAFVDNKRNMRICNCHASVTLIGNIMSLVIILRITKSHNLQRQKFGPLTCTQSSWRGGVAWRDVCFCFQLIFRSITFHVRLVPSWAPKGETGDAYPGREISGEVFP